MLVLAPAACCLAGLALSEVTSYLAASLAAQPDKEADKPAEGAAGGGTVPVLWCSRGTSAWRLQQVCWSMLCPAVPHRHCPTISHPVQARPPAPTSTTRRAGGAGTRRAAPAAAGWLAPCSQCPAMWPLWAW